MDDYAEKQTDTELLDLESRIRTAYSRAAKELTAEANTYFAKFEDRDNEMQKKVDAGEMTENEYKQWRITQMGRGKRWEAVRDEMASRMTNYNQVAASYINDKTPGIYSLNHNYTAFEIENATGVSFNIVDEQTVKRLLTSDQQVLPFTASAINVQKDNVWNQRKIQNELLNGILTGKSIDKLASGMMHVTNMNYNSAVRNARTAITGAQNAGRQEGFNQAVSKGIELQKEWMSMRDKRVRDSHAHLDGVRIEEDETFPNGCKYPGDMKGPAWEVYNCRCTMRAVLPGFKNEKVHVTGNTVDSYNKWLQKKQEKARNSLASGESNGILRAAHVADQNTNTFVKFNPDNDYSIKIDRYPEVVNDALSAESRRLAEISSKEGVEYSSLIDAVTGKVIMTERGEYNMTGTEFYNYCTGESARKCIFLHTHALDGSLSAGDMEVLMTTSGIDCVIAVRNDGVKYVAPLKPGASADEFLFMIYGDKPEEELVKLAIRDYTEGYYEQDGRI